MTRTMNHDRGPGRLRFVAFALVPALLGATVLGGCRDSWYVSDDRALLLGDPSARHEIGLAERIETIHVELRPGTSGLSLNQEDDIAGFMRQYRAQGVGAIRVEMPTAARDQGPARGALGGVRRIADEHGIQPSAIEVVRQKGGSHRGGVLTVSFARPQTVPPVCGDWPEDLGVNRERVNHPDHGCATQRAIAIMTASPRDLMTPQAETPRPSERRAAIWSGYNKTTAGGGGGEAPSKGADAGSKR